MLKAIIIDDDVDVVSTLDALLDAYNFEVLGRGYNGKEAVDLYKKLSPEIVLLDMMMPAYDGFYAINGIRSVDSYANIVAVTGDCRSETIDKLKDMNIDIIYKPFDIQQLIVLAHKIIERMKKSTTTHI